MRGLAAATVLLCLGLLAVPGWATSSEDLEPVAGRWSVELTAIGRRSGEPRSVTIWFVVADERVYLQAGKDGKTAWYRNLRENPDVRLDFGSLELRGRARPIDEPSQVTRIHDLFLRKYWTARVMSWFGGGFGTGRVVAVDISSEP